ncbi:MAG: hypothetical protein KKF68_02900 [Nanoarchaeota archaeon]|nr:hypothetical protein [Nanoarchaeota archaeon]
MLDIISEKALQIIEDSNTVLETKEILDELENSIKDITRTKLFARLNNIRGDGLIKGKFVGPGKGVWIWWSKNAFNQNKKGVKND